MLPLHIGVRYVIQKIFSTSCTSEKGLLHRLNSGSKELRVIELDYESLEWEAFGSSGKLSVSRSIGRTGFSIQGISR